MNLSEDYMYRFSGVGRLYGFKALERLAQSHVAVVGLGGVGSWVVEALARTGIGQLTLVDHDDICVSNFNRQIHAYDPSVGQLKAQAMADRVRGINKEAQVNMLAQAFSQENAADIFCRPYDFVVDAIDGIWNKCILVEEAKKRNIPVLVMGSVGGKRDPSQVRIDDLSRSVEDQLLMYVKKKMRQDFNYPRNKKAFKVPCVFSSERPVYFNDSCITLEKPKDLLKPLDCQSGMGTVSFVSGTFGFVAASYVVKSLLAADVSEPSE